MLRCAAMNVWLHLAGCGTVLLLAGCASSVLDRGGDGDAWSAIDETLAAFHDADPELQGFLARARGYAVFPTVGADGARSGGLLFEGGRVVGSVAIVDIRFAAKVGDQTFSEIVCFEDRATLAEFKDGRFELDASASAIAIARGAARAASYLEGVVVFTRPKRGAVAAATIQGQSFRYEPLAARPS